MYLGAHLTQKYIITILNYLFQKFHSTQLVDIIHFPQHFVILCSYRSCNIDIFNITFCLL